jgi:hypothetical protein
MMASQFEITATSDVVTIDPQTRQGKADFAVTNKSDKTIWGRAVAKAINAAAQSWLTIVDDAERPFQPGEGLSYIVIIKVPPEVGAGSYLFKLDMVDASSPEKTDASSPVVKIGIPGALQIPWRTIAIVAAVGHVLLIIEAFTTYYYYFQSTALFTAVGVLIILAIIVGVVVVRNWLSKRR